MITYREIFKISAPIMVGSAVQNIIALTDLMFAGRLGPVQLGAIGLVGVFYLIIASIGYGFSKGGQIMIARRMGEGRINEVGMATYSLLTFEMCLAAIMFLFVKFLGPWFFKIFLDSEAIYQACIDFLDYRIYGVFFSYAGVTAMALFTGVARTNVIIYNAVVLGVSNVFLNYCLVFGHWGFPAMGMAGSGLASTLAEGLAFSIFVVYMIIDRRRLDEYGFFKRPFHIQHHKSVLEDLRESGLSLLHYFEAELETIKVQLKLALPIVLQSVVGLGSWLIFFIIVENIGETELAISNLLRAVYLLFMIPCWGFSSGINTIASNLIGKKEFNQVMTAIGKTAFMSFAITGILSVSLFICPALIFKIGTDEADIIAKAVDLVWILIVALALYSISSIYFNGLAGTGATGVGLRLQILGVVLYLLYIYIAVVRLKGGLEFAWMSEFMYWIVIFLLSFFYLKSHKWEKIKL